MRRAFPNLSLDFLQQALDALSDHLCVVDRSGRILLTNEAWQRFADENGGTATAGDNYLNVCRVTAVTACPEAEQFRQGLREVLEGHRGCFVQEYACHSPTEERWFLCRITRMEHQGQHLAVVSHQNITSEIQAKQSLQQREALFRAIFDQSITGMVQCNLEGRFELVNPAFCRITGYREDELLRANFMDITLPEDLEADLQQVHRLLDGELSQGYGLEKRYCRKDGRVIWVNLHVSLVRNPDGTPRCLVGVVDEITDRKQAEESLEHQRNELLQTFRKLHTVIATIGDGITMSDAEGQFSIYNHQMEQITGYSMREANNTDSFMRLLYPDPEEYREALMDLELLERHGEHRNVETTITSKNGIRRTLSVSSVIVELDGKKQFLSAWHDITSRKQLTDALIASERQLSTITRTAGEAIIMMDGKGRITYWNQAAESIFGYSLEETIGQDLHRLLAPQRYQAAARNGLRTWQDTMEGSAIGRCIELFGLRKDGSEFPLELTLSTVSLHDSITAIGIARDITERYRAAEALRQAKEAAEAASQAKSSFLANMSHELRTPLNAIIGFSELIHDGVTGPVTDQQQEYLGNVLTSARHLLHIISEILDLARIEAGRLILEPAPCSLTELLLQVQSLFTEQFRSRGISLQCIPRHPTDLMLMADEVKLRQVLINLLSNALKFTDTGGEVRLAASLADSDQGAQVVIEISDTGIGIREEDLPKLFQEFSQIEPTMSRNREGSGLGLALSRRLVELHGGSISVASRPGVGSCFTVTLPIRKQDTP